MNIRDRRKLTKRFFAYLYDMKKGEETKVAFRIMQDFEMYTMQQASQKFEHQKKIEELKKKLKEIK